MRARGRAHRLCLAWRGGAVGCFYVNAVKFQGSAREPRLSVTLARGAIHIYGSPPKQAGSSRQSPSAARGRRRRRSAARLVLGDERRLGEAGAVRRRLAHADAHLPLALQRHAAHVGGDGRQLVRRRAQEDGHGGARGHVHALEAKQLLQRHAVGAGAGRRQEALHDVVRVHGAGVGDVDPELGGHRGVDARGVRAVVVGVRRQVRAHGRQRHGGRRAHDGVRERRVRQAIPERQHRRARVEAVRLAGVAAGRPHGRAGAEVHVKQRHLVHVVGGVQRRHHAAGGHRVAKDGARDGVAAAAARVAGPDDGADLGVGQLRGDVDGAARLDHQHHGALGGGRHGGDELRLHARPADDGAVMALRLLRQVVARDDHRRVRTRGGGCGGRETVSGGARGRAALHKVDGGVVAQRHGRRAQLAGAAGAVVIRVHDVGAVGGGAHDGDALDGGLGQRQHAGRVLDEHHALLRAVQRERNVLGRAHVLRAQRQVGLAVGGVEHAQAQLHQEQVHQVRVQLRLGHQAVGDRGQQALRVGRAAVNVRARQEGRGHRRRQVGRIVVRVVHVADGVAVAGDVAVEVPLLHRHLRQDEVVGARRDAVDGVIRAHQRRGAALRDGGAKGRQQRVRLVLRRDDGVEAVALRAVPVLQRVRGVVLGARGHLDVARVVALLQAADQVDCVLGRQVDVLAGRLLRAAPARVAGVDVGRPVGQASSAAVVHRAALGGDNAADGVPQRAVPRRAGRDHLRERGGAGERAAKVHAGRVRDAVQRLAPPLVAGDAQAVHAVGAVDGERDLLGQREVGDHPRRARGEVERRVAQGRAHRGLAGVARARHDGARVQALVGHGVHDAHAAAVRLRLPLLVGVARGVEDPHLRAARGAVVADVQHVGEARRDRAVGVNRPLLQRGAVAARRVHGRLVRRGLDDGDAVAGGHQADRVVGGRHGPHLVHADTTVVRARVQLQALLRRGARGGGDRQGGGNRAAAHIARSRLGVGGDVGWRPSGDVTQRS
eukprot:Partr_v1_DN5092_c0_g1_i1_m31391